MDELSNLPLNFSFSHDFSDPFENDRHRSSREVHRPANPVMVPWDALAGYISEATDEPQETKKPKARRKSKPISTKTAKRRKRGYNERQVERSGREKLQQRKRESRRKRRAETAVDEVAIAKQRRNQRVRQQRTRQKRQKRAEAEQRALETAIQTEETNLKANWPVQPSWRQQLRSIKAFRNASSFPASQLLTCGCCTQQFFPDEGIKAVHFKTKTMQNAKELLKNPHEQKLPSQCRSFAGLLLDDTAINAERKTITLCNACKQSLSRNKRPLLSLANGLWLGPPLPAEFNNMRLPEELLCCPNIGKICVLTLMDVAGPGTGQRAFKPHTVVFPQDLMQISKHLPHATDLLTDRLQVIFIGSTLPKRDDPRLTRILSVRASLVARFMLWQKRNNPRFKDIQIDTAALEQVVQQQSEQKEQEEVPECLYNAIKIVSAKRTLDEDHGPNPDAAAQQADMATSSAVLDINGLQVPQTEQARVAFHSNSEEDAQQTLLIPHGRAPVASFGNPDYWYLTFPLLFPYGVGAPPMDSSLSLRKWAKWAVKLKDRRFARHTSFMFFLQNLIQRIAVCASARLMVQFPSFRSTAETLQLLNSNNVGQLMQSLVPQIDAKSDELQGEAKLAPVGEAVQTLKYKVQLLGGRLTGTDFERIHMRRECFSMITAFGPPTFFITLNFSDVHSPLAIHIAGHEVNLNLDATDLPPDLPNLRERALLLAKDPVASARAFDRRVKLTLRYLFGYTSPSERVHPQDRLGIFGRVLGYYGSVEAQKKGTLHLHLVLWLLHALLPHDFISKLEQDIDYRKRVFAWIWDCIKQSLPEQVKPFEQQQSQSEAVDIKSGPSDEDQSLPSSPSLPLSESSFGAMSTTSSSLSSPMHLPSPKPMSIEHNRSADSAASLFAVSDSKAERQSSNILLEQSQPALSPLAIEAKRERRQQQQHPSCRRVPDPDSATFAEQAQRDLEELIPLIQMHNQTHRSALGQSTCLKPDGTCRFHFPRDLHPEMKLEDGVLYLKRDNAWVNAWNHILTICLRCNIDIRLILSGRDCKAVVMYICNYITKKQDHQYNLLPMFEAALQSLEQESKANANMMADPIERSRKLLIKCVNKTIAQIEKSAPEVAAFLLGNPNAYSSHKFNPLYFVAFKTFAEKQLQALGDSSSMAEQKHPADNLVGLEDFSLETDWLGERSLGSTVADYIWRPKQAEQQSLYEFLSNGHRVRVLSAGSESAALSDAEMDNAEQSQSENASDSEDNANDSEQKREKGVLRANFLPQHPQHNTHQWQTYAEMRVPVIIGPAWPSRNSNAEGFALFALLILYPWRSIRDMLECKGQIQSWTDALTRLQRQLSPSMQQKLANIEALHEGKSQARAERDLHRSEPSNNQSNRLEVKEVVAGLDAEEAEEPDEINDSLDSSSSTILTIRDLVEVSRRERRWTEEALRCAIDTDACTAAKIELKSNSDEVSKMFFISRDMDIDAWRDKMEDNEYRFTVTPH